MTTVLVDITAWRRLLSVVVLSLAPVCTAQAQDKVQGPRRDAKDVVLEIEVRKGGYRVADSVDIRLTIRNKSGDPITFNGGPATSLASLTVLDASDRPVGPNVLPPISLSTASQLTLPAHGQKVLVDDSGNEWIKLRNWGYELRVPGSYSIVGYPIVGGFNVKSDRSLRSNRAKFTVKP
jgi:hypothetical protein